MNSVEAQYGLNENVHTIIHSSLIGGVGAIAFSPREPSGEAPRPAARVTCRDDTVDSVIVPPSPLWRTVTGAEGGQKPSHLCCAASNVPCDPAVAVVLTRGYLVRTAGDPVRAGR